LEYNRIIRSLLLSMAIVAILTVGLWAAVASSHMVDAQVIRAFTLFVEGGLP